MDCSSSDLNIEKFLILVEIFLDIAYYGRPQEHLGMTQVWILQLSVIEKCDDRI